jgi:hypothetical protein
VKEEQAMKTGWWKIVLFAGLLVVASVSAGLGKEPWEVGTQDGSGIWVGFSMTPQVPHLGETAEVVGKVVAAACDVPEAEIFFGDGKGNLIGVELVNCKQSFTTSLKRGVPKEFRFKIKFVGSPAEVQVYANARYYRESDGSIIPDRIHGVAGYGLVMNKKTKEFRMPDLMKDPYSDLQEELGLPQGGYWYSVTVSLSFDIKEYAKQRKQSEEEVINLLKAKAVALAKQRKIKKEEAYRVISKERLLWKDAGLPDPFYRSLEQQQKDSRLKLQKNPSSKVATRLSGYWYYDDHHYDWQTSLQKSLGDTFTPSALIILVLALILGILFSASKAFNPFRIKEEQAMKTGWRRVVALLGLLLVVGMGISMADVRTLHMGVTIDPVNPRLDEVTEITVKVWEGTYPEVPKLEINLSNSRGIELLDVSPKTVLALRGKEAKECRFRVKYISSPAEFIVTAMYKKIRYTNGRLIDIQDDPRDPSWGLANGEGEVLYMYEKDKRFYSQSALQSLLHPDPAVVLQQELSLPDVGNEKSYWYAIALHLNGDIEDFSKAKKLSREAVIKLLKDKAEVLAKNEKITKEKTYETILRRRLLWKDAGLPDPHNIKNRPDLLKDQGSLRSPPVKGYTGVDGWWFYDDHKYDLQNGLQVSLSDTFTPIRYCKFEVTDIGCDSYPRSETLDASGYTGEDGSFSSSFILPHGEQIYHIFIKCYAKGPSDLNPRINVLDSTNQTYYCTIPTSVVSNHAGSYKLHVPRYDSQNYPQPRSGAWNIYDILYRGFKKTYASTLLHVWWDPNKFRLTGFVPDTLWVNGSDYSYYHPDVWNDDVLLHEYGHYVYNNWTNYIEGGGATWYLAKPDFPNRAFIEGWGDFFSGVVRDSLPDTLRGRSWGPNDSLIVQTRGHIGAGQDSLDYVCLENPWHFSWFGFRDSSAFEGGPYCRGAVAGALYDIMDRYGENPYPSHPYPGWPDTIPLADTLRIRVSPFAPLQSPYFNIMKNWRSGWLSGNHGVLTIYDFLSGWCYPPDPSRQGYILSSYGHERVIKDILTHHRIKWEKPPAPFNVRAFWDGVKFVIRLYWVMNWPPLGPQPSNPRCFNVYRAVGTPPLSYQKLNSVMDTLFVG